MYKYAEARDQLFTDCGQVLFLKVRDRVNKLLDLAGAVRVSEASRSVGGDSWMILACFDRMVELGGLREVTTGEVWGQDRIFTR